MSDICLHRFSNSEWQTYRTLRLQALKDAPDAFGSTFEEAIVQPDHCWVSRLNELSPAADLPLRAEIRDRPVQPAPNRKK